LPLLGSSTTIITRTLRRQQSIGSVLASARREIGRHVCCCCSTAVVSGQTSCDSGPVTLGCLRKPRRRCGGRALLFAVIFGMECCSGCWPYEHQGSSVHLLLLAGLPPLIGNLLYEAQRQSNRGCFTAYLFDCCSALAIVVGGAWFIGEESCSSTAFVTSCRLHLLSTIVLRVVGFLNEQAMRCTTIARAWTQSLRRYFAAFCHGPLACVRVSRKHVLKYTMANIWYTPRYFVFISRPY
jgi:hypothetical protein